DLKLFLPRRPVATWIEAVLQRTLNTSTSDPNDVRGTGGSHGRYLRGGRHGQSHQERPTRPLENKHARGFRGQILDQRTRRVERAASTRGRQGWKFSRCGSQRNRDIRRPSLNPECKSCFGIG